MADAFTFELVTPERLLLSEQVTSAMVPGEAGDFTVLAGHAPFMSTIRPGIVDVDVDGGASQRFFVVGGFADAGPSGLTILAEQATPVAEIDISALESQAKDLAEDVADAADDDSRLAAQMRLDQLTQAIGVLKAG